MEKTINELIEEYQKKRIRFSDVCEMMDTLLDRVRNTTAFKDLDREKKILNESIQELRPDIYSVIIADYNEDGNKKPHPEVEIKSYKEIELLDEQVIIHWAVRNASSVLKLDMTKLKKYAIGAAEAGAPLDGIGIKETPKVFISDPVLKLEYMKYPMGTE